MNKQTKRVFIAINFSDDAKKQIEEYKQEIQNYFSEEYNSVFKWVGFDNYHLTLSFLGDLLQPDIDELIEILTLLCSNLKKTSICFKKIDFGPIKNKPKLIWLTGKVEKELIEFKKSLDDVLLENEFIKKEDVKRFIPHMTIARIRTWQWKAINQDERPEIEKDIDLKIPVNSIDLMESKLKRTGSEYAKIKTFGLKD